MPRNIEKSKSRFSIQRQLGIELPGLGKAGALERRPYGPGQHGARRKKLSDFAIQLREKQKLRYHYVLREYQLVNYIKRMKKDKTQPWVDKLVKTLETRLDNVIFRGQFANSIASARQLISHGHVLINGKKVSVSRYELKVGDKITLREKGYKGQTYVSAQHSPRIAEVPAYLTINANGEFKEIEVVGTPEAIDIPFEFESRLVTDFYGKIK